jgi:Domain of unknown function (DUF1772)
MFSISIMAVPALLVAQPRTTLKQWTNMYDLGRVTSPPSVLFSSLVFFYLSYRTHPATTYLTGENEWTLYLAAGTVVGAVLPFSFGVMERTNQELLRFGTPREGGKEPLKKEDEDRIRVLIGRWKGLNLVRSAMLAIGAGIGVYAVLG